jgi:hypothetical protein
MTPNPHLIRVPAHTGQETALDQRKYFIVGLAATILGTLASVAGFMFAHFTGLDELDSIGREIYPSIPRGWLWVLAGQMVSLGGALLAMGGLALAFLYERKMTWARASLGAALFTALMLILFGIVPNQWLTLAQGPWDWSSAKIAIRVIGEPGGGLPLIPKWLVLNNEVAVSFAAVKEAIVAGYVTNLLIVIAVVMYKWQEREKARAAGPPPKPVSVYGRPVTKIGRG